MPIELPSVRPSSAIYFIGDSNSLLYQRLTVDVPDYFAIPIVTHPCFVPSLSAKSILIENSLNPRITDFLMQEHVIRFLDRYVRVGKYGEDVLDRTWAQTILPPLHDIYNVADPLAVVIMIGTIDAAMLLAELGANVDFACTDPRFVEAAFDGPDHPLVPRGLVCDLIDRHFAPLGTAIRLLREMNLGPIYLHSLHPPTTDDALYYRARQTMSSAKLRYKLCIEINRTFARIAERDGARFLDVWTQTVRDGVLDPHFELDGDHLNRNAVDVTLRTLLDDIVAVRGTPLPLAF